MHALYTDMVCFVLLSSRARNSDSHQRIAKAPSNEAVGSSFDVPQSSETHATEPLGKF